MVVQLSEFSRYMQQQLYGENGFYTKGKGPGRNKDYITSPEVGDLFGYVIAGYIDKWLKSIEENEAVILEVGSGTGSLAASIARAGLKSAVNVKYVLVDISEMNRVEAQEKLKRVNPNFEWSVLENIPELEVPTLVLANELLDNLIFDIGHFKDYRIPIHVGIEDFFDELEAALTKVSNVSILMFDYMRSVFDMSDENWLRLYNEHQRIVGVDNVLLALEKSLVGDITTDVKTETLHEVLETKGFSNTRIYTQSKWLQKNLIDSYCELESQMGAYEMAEAFIRNPSRSTQGFKKERQVLMDPQGLGSFGVLQSHRVV